MRRDEPAAAQPKRYPKAFENGLKQRSVVLGRSEHDSVFVKRPVLFDDSPGCFLYLAEGGGGLNDFRPDPRALDTFEALGRSPHEFLRGILRQRDRCVVDCIENCLDDLVLAGGEVQETVEENLRQRSKRAISYGERRLLKTRSRGEIAGLFQAPFIVTEHLNKGGLLSGFEEAGRG